MILGILIFLVGMVAITIIIEHFPMTHANAILVWDHDALAFRGPIEEHEPVDSVYLE